MTAASTASATGLKQVRAVDPPTVHLSWNAPYGDPRARTSITSSCSDTTRSDTLWLTFEPKQVIHHLSISGTVLFEPQVGDTLGSFWFFERGGKNAGNLMVAFNLPRRPDLQAPWRAMVDGHVGYTRVGGRGRLDLSGNGYGAEGTLEAGRLHVFAWIVINERRLDLEGCGQPIAVKWVGMRMPTRFEGMVMNARGPDQYTTWNARRSGLTTRDARLALGVWTPAEAPPSRDAIYPMTRQPKITVEMPPADADSVTRR